MTARASGFGAYRWWLTVLAMGGFAVTIGIGNWAFGAFVTPLEAEFGWSRTELAGLATIGIFAVAAGAPLVGWWVDRWGVRTAFIVGAITCGAAFVALAYAQELWQFYALYGLASFFRTLTSYIPLVTIVSRWFPEKRGGPLGLLLAGVGLGGAAFAPLATFLIANWGWRVAFVYLGIILGVYFLLFAVFVREGPTREGDASYPPPGDPAHPEPRDPSHPHPGLVEGRPAEPAARLSEAIRTRPFWMLNLAIALTWFAQMAFVVHAQPFMEWRGFTPYSAAFVVGASALVASFARLGLGPAYDSLGRPYLFVVAICTAGGLSLVFITASTGPLSLGAFLLLWAIGSGGSALLPALLLSQTYGSRYLGSFLAFTEVTGAAGTLSGPIIGGVVFDASGSYVPAFAACALVFLLAGFAFGSFVRTAGPLAVAAPLVISEAAGNVTPARGSAEERLASRRPLPDTGRRGAVKLFGFGALAGTVVTVLWWLAVPAQVLASVKTGLRAGRDWISRRAP